MNGWPTPGIPTMSYPTIPAAKPRSIHELLSILPSASSVEHFLRENPQAVEEKGFNGNTALHRACLSPNIEVIDVLLRFNSDPNSKNQFEETPLHFACRIGNPVIVEMLLKHGGDLNLVDKAGRGPVLHAAYGGSVANLHYLTRFKGLSLNVKSKTNAYPMHIICEYGHADAIMYMLRHERCQLNQKDSHGNTYLHTAAKSGFAWICYQLVKRGGYKILLGRNNDGHTPLDLAKNGHLPQHQQVVTALNRLMPFANRAKPPPVEGPNQLWYALLGSPFIMYAGTLALCQVFTKAGFIMVLGILLNLTLISRQQHRLFHISKWPNPIFVGMFAAGLSHTTLCYILKIMPGLYELSFPFVIFSLICLTLLNWMFYKLLKMEPGSQTQPAGDCNGKPLTLLDVAKYRLPIRSFCTACEIVVPQFTKHCKICEKCYSRMDHHCLFLYRCIASNNHRLFVRFLISCFLAMVSFEIVALRHLCSKYGYEKWTTDTYWDIFQTEPWIWSLMIANGMSIGWVSCLLNGQMQVISRGVTNYFYNYYASNLTYVQRIKNICLFLTGRQVIEKDKPLEPDLYNL